MTDNLSNEQIDIIVDKIMKNLSNNEQIELESYKFAARGIQLKRKDKDIMSDTGGDSYRKKDPKFKPPRYDLRNPRKNKKPEEKDKDIDNDPDLKRYANNIISGFLSKLINKSNKEEKRMNNNDMNKIINNIAASETKESEGEDKSLDSVEKAIDYILYGIQTIEENLPSVKADTQDELSAKDKLTDLFETAINPYVADAIENLNILSGEKNE